MIKVLLSAAFVTTMFVSFMAGMSNERAMTTKRINALQSERVAREGKTDREWYAVHPEAKGS